MSGSEDVERYEAEVELQLYKEYKDVIPMFSYVVETERRFYLANGVEQRVVDEDGRSRIELSLTDAWVWDMYRQSRFVSNVKVVTYKDVIGMFTYVVETERRFYLANAVEQHVREEDGRSRIELTLNDAWVWDMYRQSRFVATVKVVTYKDVNVEELPKREG